MPNGAATLHERIKQARTRANLSQAALGNVLGQSQQVVADWENAEKPKRPPIETLERIAEITEVSPVWLVLGIGGITDGVRGASPKPFDPDLMRRAILMAEQL